MFTQILGLIVLLSHPDASIRLPAPMILTTKTEMTGSMQFSPNGQYLACDSGEKDVAIWDVRSKKLVRTVHPGYIFQLSLSFSPDSQAIATGGWDSDVRLFSVKTGRLLKTYSGGEHGSRIYGLVFTADGRKLYAATYHAYLHVWDVRTGRRSTFDSGEYRYAGLALNNKGNQLAVIGRGKGIGPFDPCIWLYDLNFIRKQKRIIDRAVNSQSDDIPDSVAYSPDGRWIVSASQQFLRIRDSKTGRLRKILAAHKDNALGESCAKFAYKGKAVISIRGRSLIRCFSIRSGKAIWAIQMGDDAWAYAISPDSRTLAYTSNGKLILQNIDLHKYTLLTI